MKTRVNITAKVNAASIRREKLNGRDVIIVPSATMPDDVIMNGIMYPAAEIAKGFKSLERTPAPLGHPTINGNFVSASDPEGLNLGYIGAWNSNVRQEKGRVLIDKIIDVEFASQTVNGKRVLDAIDRAIAEETPIHTSTGLYAMMEEATGDVPYKRTARNIVFDHDAILLDEDGAATPEQGVGLLVNSQGVAEEIPVINSTLDEDVDRQLDWAVDALARALEAKARLPLLEQLKSKALALLGFGHDTPTNTKDDAMPVTDEQFNALKGEVAAMASGIKTLTEGLGTTVANAVAEGLKPVNEHVAALNAASKAAEETELKGLREQIVKANLMPEAAANELTLNAARALAQAAKPGTAANLNAGFVPQGQGDKPLYQLPEGED